MSERSRQAGQVLVLSAAVTGLLFVPLSVYLIDTALVESAHAQLGETLQAAAEDGASMIDQDAFRTSDGQRVVLDPVAARETSERSLRASALPGLDSWTVTVRANTVTVTATVHVQLLVVGPTTLTVTRSAGFVYGS